MGKQKSDGDNKQLTEAQRKNAKEMCEWLLDHLKHKEPLVAMNDEVAELVDGPGFIVNEMKITFHTFSPMFILSSMNFDNMASTKHERYGIDYIRFFSAIGDAVLRYGPLVVPIDRALEILVGFQSEEGKCLKYAKHQGKWRVETTKRGVKQFGRPLSVPIAGRPDPSMGFLGAFDDSPTASLGDIVKSVLRQS